MTILFLNIQDMFVIAKKIDTNLDAVKAALQDAHAVFREVRRTRVIVGGYSSAISGMAEPGPPAPTGLMNADELGLSPGAQAILLKRKVRPFSLVTLVFLFASWHCLTDFFSFLLDRCRCSTSKDSSMLTSSRK